MPLPTMPPHFREDRATQAAAKLLKLRGGRMSYLKLLKLMYLADRLALIELGRPITFDLLVSMPKGPVLSQTYNLILDEPEPTSIPSYWHRYVSPPESYDVRLLEEPTAEQLSEAEEKILERVFDEFGHRNRWWLVEYTHSLPEYKDPEGSSTPINIRDILRAEGMKPDDIEALVGALKSEALLEQLPS